MCRLDAIACDAELQEKSEAELQRLAEQLSSQCEAAMREFEEQRRQEQPQEGPYSIYTANGVFKRT